jgi:hypothetical protein
VILLFILFNKKILVQKISLLQNCFWKKRDMWSQNSCFLGKKKSHKKGGQFWVRFLLQAPVSNQTIKDF